MHRPRYPPTHHDLPAIILRNKYVRLLSLLVHPRGLCMLVVLCTREVFVFQELCMWDPPTRPRQDCIRGC